MPIASLQTVSAYCQWTDDVGAVTLYTSALRFNNWTPMQDDVGPEEVGYGTGQVYKFVERVDFGATFEMSAMPPVTVPLLLRLKSWLNRGGTVTVVPMDLPNNSWTCTKWPGYQIKDPIPDRKKMRYAMTIGVLNSQDAPMQPIYNDMLGVGYLVTVTPNSVVLGGNVGQTTQLTASVTDANGNPIAGQTVVWSSTDPTVANVDQTGLVSAVASGGCAVIAQVGATSVQVPVTVNISQTAATITLSGPSTAFTATTYTGNPTLGVSGVPSVTLTATLQNGSGQTLPVTAGMLTWSNTGTGLQLVDNNNGTCTVTAIKGSTSGTISVALASNANLNASQPYSTVASNACKLIPSTYSVSLSGIGQKATVNILATIDQYGTNIP